MIPKGEEMYIRAIRGPTEDSLKGRAGTVHVDGPGVNVLYIVGYCYPEVNATMPDPRNVKIWDWINLQLNNCAGMLGDIGNAHIFNKTLRKFYIASTYLS